MYKIYLVLLLITQANFTLTFEPSRKIHKAIGNGVFDFSNLTPTQEAQYLPQINSEHYLYGLPLQHAIQNCNKRAVDWLLSKNARVDGKIFKHALIKASPKTIAKLLKHNAPTDIEIEGKKPIAYIESQIASWQDTFQRSQGRQSTAVLDILRSFLEKYKKTHALLVKHEKLKRISGLVQIDQSRPAELSERVVVAPLVTAAACRDKSRKIYKAIGSHLFDFSDLTLAQEALFLPYINSEWHLFTHYIPYGIPPLEYAASQGNEKAVRWLLSKGATPTGKAFAAAIIGNQLRPGIIEELLKHNVPTDVQIGGKKPIKYIENEIVRWQRTSQEDQGDLYSAEKLEQYEKAHDLLVNHEFKLRMTWIRGLVQMGRPIQAEWREREVTVPVVTTAAPRIEVISETGSTPVVITRAASPGMSRDTTPLTPSVPARPASPSLRLPRTLSAHGPDSKCCCLQ